MEVESESDENESENPLDFDLQKTAKIRFELHHIANGK